MKSVRIPNSYCIKKIYKYFIDKNCNYGEENNNIFKINNIDKRSNDENILNENKLSISNE